MDDKDQKPVTDYSDENSITIDLGSYDSCYAAAGTTMAFDFTTSGIDTITLPSSYGSSFSFADSSTTHTNIDLKELAETLRDIKERLLILTPNFQMHEKYPMLKELYDEYKAMERLLSGPDRSLDDGEL